MDLEEMKNEWDAMSKDIEKQKILTNKLIIDMTQEKYNNKIKSISIPETIGAIICFASALFILFNFYKLEEWYIIACGIFSVVYLIVLPLKVLLSLNKMKKINIASQNVKQTLIDFSEGKKQFWKIQRIGFFLNFVFVIAILPLFGKLLSNKNLFLEAKLWYLYVPILVGFLIVFSMWGFKHYKKSSNSAENILKELEL